MRVLVVTGQKAAEIVKKSTGDMADILALDIDIAAFTTPNRLKKSIENEHYDLIIIPGLVSADFSRLETHLNIPIRLGPKNAVDLGMILSYLDQIELSTTTPACELLRDVRQEAVISTLIDMENNADYAFMLGSLKIGCNSIMKVMAEIVDATALSEELLTKKIHSFQEKGADIIDLGVGMAATVEEVENTVTVARKTATVPLSIDTLKPELIIAAVESGVDMVLSLNATNIRTVSPVIARSGTTAVVIPDGEKGLKSLIANINLAQDMGISKIIADPVLDPPGQNMVDSIIRYKHLRQSYPEIPMFFGAGNITELMDADSVGLNALLTAISRDVGADILFTPEYSDKARGSIAELKRASQMMAMAEYRSSPPKDLGTDLLILKEKRFRPFDMIPGDYIKAKGSCKGKGKWKCDPAGSFKISISNSISGSNSISNCNNISSSSKLSNGILKNGMIIARHTNCTIIGDSAQGILDTALDMGLVSKLDHAAYLGRELMRAELAIMMGRSFSQDDDF